MHVITHRKPFFQARFPEKDGILSAHSSPLLAPPPFQWSLQSWSRHSHAECVFTRGRPGCLLKERTRCSDDDCAASPEFRLTSPFLCDSCCSFCVRVPVVRRLKAAVGGGSSGEPRFLAVPVFCCCFFFFLHPAEVLRKEKTVATQLCENRENAENTLVSKAWIFK